jgi:hypothetical protein
MNTMALRRLSDLYQRVGRSSEAESARTALWLAANNNTGK